MPGARAKEREDAREKGGWEGAREGGRGLGFRREVRSAVSVCAEWERERERGPLTSAVEFPFLSVNRLTFKETMRSFVLIKHKRESRRRNRRFVLCGVAHTADLRRNA
jgi:hypothetical protein